MDNSTKELKLQNIELNERISEQGCELTQLRSKCEKYRMEKEHLTSVLNEKTKAFKNEVEEWEKQYNVLKNSNTLIEQQCNEMMELAHSFGFRMLDRDEAIHAYIHGKNDIFMVDVDNLAVFNIAECTLNSLSVDSSDIIYLESRCK